MSEVASLENQRRDREQAEDKLREERRKLLTQQIIDESDPDNIVITYKRNGVVVATKTIAVSGTTTTVTRT
jgi:hypothetical protein